LLLGRVAVLGTGLIGGSIGLGLRAGGAADEVRGFDPDSGAARAAHARAAIDVVATELGEAVSGASFVVLCLPVDRIADACRELAAHVEVGTVVTDVGSAKVEVVAQGERWLGGRFVGGHPMAGSERHGIEGADGRLFEDAWWILTPTAQTQARAYARVAELAHALGAKPVAVAPEVHDALVARLSHVPQLAASALVDLALAAGDRQSLLGLAGPGFRDVTRIAASRPELWVAIIRANRAAVAEALKALGGRLDHVSDMIARGSWIELREFLARARAARLELFAKPGQAGDPITLSMLVPDRPGVLAEVTTAAGELGANIEDLRIVHSTEGGRGRVELVIAGKEAAELLVAALLGKGYHPERVGE